MKEIIIDMTNAQYNQLVKFLAKENIMLDGEKEFGLIAQPKMMGQYFQVILLSPKKVSMIRKIIHSKES